MPSRDNLVLKGQHIQDITFTGAVRGRSTKDIEYCWTMVIRLTTGETIELHPDQGGNGIWFTPIEDPRGPNV